MHSGMYYAGPLISGYRKSLPNSLRRGLRQANSFLTKNQALFTSPERRHRVQTCIVFAVPSTTTLTLRTLGCCVVNARRETCERVMLIFLPKNVSF